MQRRKSTHSGLDPSLDKGSERPRPKRSKVTSLPASSSAAATSASAFASSKKTVQYAQRTNKDKDSKRDAEAAAALFSPLLGALDADLSRCTPGAADVAAYETARREAEADADTILETASAPATVPLQNGQQIQSIIFGNWKIGTWYAAPYPEEYCQLHTLYICEFCLKYMKSPFMTKRHKLKCPLKSPPGNEIYRDGIISIFEVDGRKNKIYCQNLCLLAKMFLDHKTLYYDVEPFLFYIMTERDTSGFHFVGYFSKEKRSGSNYNLSCILTLPIHQRKGYGHLLIDFSYLLSKKEEKPGSPEKPLSDLGLLSYRSYWRIAVLSEIRCFDKETISIAEIASRTCMTVDDVVSTLTNLDMLVKDSKGEYVIRYNVELVDECLAKFEAKKYPTIKPNLLRWTRYEAPKKTVVI